MLYTLSKKLEVCYWGVNWLVGAPCPRSSGKIWIIPDLGCGLWQMNLKAENVSRSTLIQYDTGQVLEAHLCGIPLLLLWAISFTVLLLFFFFLINWNFSARLKTCVTILLENYSELLCSGFGLYCLGRSIQRCWSHGINVPFASLLLAWHTTHTEKCCTCHCKINFRLFKFGVSVKLKKQTHTYASIHTFWPKKTRSFLPVVHGHHMPKLFTAISLIPSTGPDRESVLSPCQLNTFVW